MATIVSNKYVVCIADSLLVFMVEQYCSADEENQQDNVKYLQAKEITKWKGKLAATVDRIRNIIDSQQCDIQQLILKLCVSDENNLTVFSTDEAFTKITTTTELFFHIGRYINIYDYDLLSAFVESTECVEAITVLNRFTINLHNSILKGLDLMTECGELQPEQFPSGACRLVIKYVGGECTINHKRIVQNIISERFQLPKGSIIFRGVEEGCIALKYQISIAVKLHLLQYKLDDVLTQQKIQCLVIDDVMLPSFSKVCVL